MNRGGRKLHVICSGTGSPTVVLEAGANSLAIDWSLVPGSGHEIHLFVPSAVIEAIQDVVTAARDKSRLPARP